MIYLDNAATTFPKSEAVYAEMDRINRNCAVNAGRGSYQLAREATAIIDETRTRLQTLFHADADIVFTPSVTHAMNQIVRGLSLTENDTVYISPYEHNAVARTLHDVAVKTGCQVRQLPLKHDLTIDLQKTAYQFSVNRPDVLIVTAISNVTGYMLPVGDIFKLAKEYSAITIIDAAQAAGLIDLDMRQLNADVICFAGHKTLYGPFGVGGFAIRRGVQLSVTFTGGTGSNSLNTAMPEMAPDKYEAASPNIIAIGGLLAALQEEGRENHFAHVKSLTEYAIERFAELPNVRVLGICPEAKPLGIISFIVDGYDSNDVGEILDREFDIAVRTGYHCAPYVHDWLCDRDSNGTIRIGIGKYNTEQDIDALIEALDSL